MSITWTTPDNLRNSASPDAEYAIEVASWILYKLTAEKYPGIRTATEWYGLDHANCWCHEVEFSSSSLHRHIDIPFGRRIPLRHTPVRSISSVSIDSTLLNPSTYRLENYIYLARTDSCPWSLHRGVEVTYAYGQNPPTAGRRAAERLADEFILSFNSSDECRLPDRITAISRQGVSYTVMDPQEFLSDGRTGIYEIDLFIQAANPAKARQKPKVYSPDLPRRTV